MKTWERTALYCRRCLGFKRYADEGEDVSGLEGDRVLRWIPACEWCLERQAERRAEIERLERLWATRICAADGCDELFQPKTPMQRFHSDSCRWRAYRKLKAKRAAG